MANNFKDKLHSILKTFEDTKLSGYVPTPSSGVTIATGFDLGQHNKQDIKNLNLPKALEDKLTPYAGSTDAKKAANLTITAEEAALLDKAVIDSKLNSFNAAYVAKFGENPDQSLDENTRLALASAFFNMGPGMLNAEKNPSMFKALQSKNPALIQKEIANFHRGAKGQPESRRLVEAGIAAGFIDPEDTQSVNNFKDLMAKNPQARKVYQSQWVSQQQAAPVAPTAQVTPQATPTQAPVEYASMEDLLMDKNLLGGGTL
jgi:hypothetical protein